MGHRRRRLTEDRVPTIIVVQINRGSRRGLVSLAVTGTVKYPLLFEFERPVVHGTGGEGEEPRVKKNPDGGVGSPLHSRREGTREVPTLVAFCMYSFPHGF